jgi:hypothetical protein
VELFVRASVPTVSEKPVVEPVLRVPPLRVMVPVAARILVVPLRFNVPAVIVVPPVKVLLPESVSVPVPAFDNDVLRVVPSVIGRRKAVGEIVPLMVKVSGVVPAALLVIEPIPPVLEEREAMVWLKPFISKVPPKVEELPIVTDVEVGNALVIPSLMVPAPALNIVAPV